jgi:uncharacterized membrane protein YphA (DoxX/SURF4 family)
MKGIRFLLALIFLMTGIMKLALPQFGESFLIQLTEAHIPLVTLNFYLVPTIEILIGLALFFNFKTNWALFLIIPIMLVAIYVHLVVKNPLAFPAQPQAPIIPLMILLLVFWYGYKTKSYGHNILR